MFKIVFVILWMQTGNELTFTLERGFDNKFICEKFIPIATDFIHRAAKPGFLVVKSAECKPSTEVSL